MSGVIARTRRRLVTTVVLAVVADALSKVAAVWWIDGAVDLGVLDLRVTYNTGLAFSVGADQPVALVLGVTGVVVVGLAVAAWRGQLGGPVGAGLVVGGGLANVVDRAVGGSVVDVFDLGRWPVFNLADVFLTIGLGLLFLSSLGHVDDVGETGSAMDGPAPSTDRASRTRRF